MGIALYSTRSATQTLSPIDGSVDMARMVDGTLLDLSDGTTSPYRKFKSTISCTDMASPAFDGFWPGMTVTVDCITELCYMTGGTASRPAVSGSTYTEGSFTIYRPQITFKVMQYEISCDEWNAAVAWHLDLEEV
jgi:hypothetical protein